MRQSFYAIVEDDFEAVNRLSLERLASNIPLVEEIGGYLIQAGGKRLRPLLVLLTARSLGYNGDLHLKLAAIIEFLHTAMLMHDDVVDNSKVRRGLASVNATWGNSASVLVGDFLHSRAFEMMVEIGNLRVMQILSRATNTITEGEVQQLTQIGNVRLGEQHYLDIIYRKTARLFEACSHAAATLAGKDEATCRALRDYGGNLGMAFQLIDDTLDYVGDEATLGKNTGTDLTEGKMTLPLIHAIRESEPTQAELLRRVVLEPGKCDLGEVTEQVVKSGAIEYTLARADEKKQLAVNALERLPPTPYREAMYNLASFVVDRSH